MKDEPKARPAADLRRDSEEPGDAPRLVPVSGLDLCFSIPPEWKEMTSYVFIGLPEGGFVTTVMLQPRYDEGSMSVQQVADAVVPVLTAQSPGFRLVRRGDVSLPSGLACHEALLQWNGPGQKNFFQWMLFLQAGSRSYTVTATFVDESGEGRNPYVEACFRSLSARDRGR